eukprot:403358589
MKTQIQQLVGKRQVQQVSIYLLSLYFIFEGLNNLFDNYRRSEQLDVKLYNLEGKLYNKGMLLFSFYDSMRPIINTFLFIYGLGILIAGSGVAFFDEKPIRDSILKLLIVVEVFEALIIHNPFTENVEARHSELYWLVKNLGICICLVLALKARV